MSFYLLLGASCSGSGKRTQYSLKVIHVTSREAAQNVPAPVTTYALFRDGRFLTQGIQSDKKFLALAGQESDRK
mgnify:CR=1 FL=1